MIENPFLPFVWLDEFERTPFDDDQWHEFATPRRINYGSGEWAWAYISVDAARAWQALRDWCNGTPEQWMAAVDAAVLYAHDQGIRAGRILR